MKILITGASSGMGKDMAKILSRKGNDLVLVARDMEKLEILKNELSGTGSNIEIISIDLSDNNNCIELYKKVRDIDILINNARFWRLW